MTDNDLLRLRAFRAELDVPALDVLERARGRLAASDEEMVGAVQAGAPLAGPVLALTPGPARRPTSGRRWTRIFAVPAVGVAVTATVLGVIAVLSPTDGPQVRQTVGPAAAGPSASPTPSDPQEAIAQLASIAER